MLNVFGTFPLPRASAVHSSGADQDGYTAGQVALLKSDLPLANAIRFFGSTDPDVFDVEPTEAPKSSEEGKKKKRPKAEL